MHNIIDQPLVGDPGVLGTSRRLTVEEIQATELHGIPRYNYWIHAILEGDDGQFYPLFLEFSLIDTPPLQSNGGKYQLGIGRASGAPVETAGYEQTTFGHLVFQERFATKRTPDGVVLFAPPHVDIDSPPGEYIKLELRSSECLLSLKKSLGGNSIELNVTFNSPELPFWYNKGKPATIFPDGTVIFGVEDVLSAVGNGSFNGKRVQLRGFGHREDFFNRGDIVQGIFKYRNECWVVFQSDQVRGVLVQFNDYRDGKLVVEGKHLVPTGFSIETLKRSQNDKPIQFRMKVTTTEGLLDITVDAFMVWAFGGLEFPSRISGAFTYNDGREVAIQHGLAWREEIA